MTLPVLQVPAGEEGGPGGFSNLLKEEDHEKGEEERQKNCMGPIQFLFRFYFKDSGKT